MSDHRPECSAKAFDEGFRRGLEVGHRIGNIEAYVATGAFWRIEEALERYLELTVERAFARLALEQSDGVVWDEKQLKQDFAILGYMMPFGVIVQRRSDGVRGSVRCRKVQGRYYCGEFYYDWSAD